jgi:photosystem II stability/assembly factor-like uncharacterized protein
MTHNDRFESHVAAAVRADAPDVAPTALRRRVESSLRAAQARGSGRRAPAFAIAAGVIVLLVALAVGAPWLARVGPGATQTGSAQTGAGTHSPSVTTPPISASLPLDEPISDPGQVQAGQLITAGDGWVVNTDSRLFLTHSGGAAWRDVTPPGLEPDVTLNPSFVDPMHGWVGEANDPTGAGVVVWRTTDAGVTWSRAVLPDVQTANWALVFQSPLVGWLATDPGGQHPKPELRWTDDGGVTWSGPIDLAAATGLPVLPELAFADREHGALTADGIVRATSDGGRRWIDASIPDLPSIATEGGNVVRFGLPTFVDPEHGFLTISVAKSDATPLTKLVFATATAGASWHLALQDDLDRSWAFVSESTWIGLADGKVWTTRDGGATFGLHTSGGLPTPLDRAYVTFVDPLHGWGQAVRGGCLPGSFGCLRGPELFATSDGGQTWTRVGDCIFLCGSPKPS